MCCGGRVCMLCTCVILVAVLIGLLFGFKVFTNGFHKIKDTFHEVEDYYPCDPKFSSCGRPFLGYAAPPPF